MKGDDWTRRSALTLEPRREPDPAVTKAVRRPHSWVVAWFATAALGLPLHLNGGVHQIRDLIHVDDIATATVRALIAPRAHNETINIGTGTPTSIRTVAELVAEQYPHTRFVETPMPPGDPLGGYATTTAWKRSSAGGRPSPSKRGWPATRPGRPQPPRRSPRG